MDASAPTASMTDWAPRPPVASSTWADPGAIRASMGSAPSRSARARRSGTMSTARMRAGPKREAHWSAMMPTGPSPITTTVAPGVMAARCAPRKPVGRMSVRSTASSSATPSGMGSAKRSANGTAMASAWPPGRSGTVPNAAVLSFRQTLGWPARQGRHTPQPMTPETSTRSPRSRLCTSGPASATVPMAS